MSSSLLTVVVACMIVALFIFGKLLLHFISSWFSLRHVPGPTSQSLIWGEEWNLYHSVPGSHYLDWHRQFGKVVRLRGAFGHQILSITDDRAVAFILGPEGIYKFPKPDGVRAWFQKTLGEGILWVEGKEAHEKQRRSLAPALTQQSVRNFTSIFYETSATLAARWMKILDERQSEEVDIEVTNWAGRFALDAVGRAAFSYDFNFLSGEPSALAEALDGLTNNENNLSSFYMRALFWIFPSVLAIGKKGEMIRTAKVELGRIARQMWQDAKSAGIDASSADKSLMKQMMDSSALNIDEDEIVSQMRTVLSAGYETVSAIVAWILYELAMNQTVQEQLRAEITASPGDPSLDELNTNYPILNSVILETLRLHPPILENHHQAAETISVPLTSPIPGSSASQLVVPKGTVLFIPVNVLQMDPEIWGEDAYLFRPERWQSQQGGRNLFAFSQGPRQCIGRRFALGEIKALTVTLIRQFSFRCPYDIEPFQSFVIRPRVKGQGASSLPLVVRRA